MDRPATLGRGVPVVDVIGERLVGRLEEAVVHGVDVRIRPRIDAEHDPVFYRITGATHGTARIASDGRSVSFTPTTGYFGPASFSIVAGVTVCLADSIREIVSGRMPDRAASRS